MSEEIKPTAVAEAKPEVSTSEGVVMPEASASASSSSVDDAVRTQIEFYLSDSNLPFDKFLFTLWTNGFTCPAPVVSSTPVPEGYSRKQSFHQGWVPLSKLCSFKRMAPYLEAPPSGLGSVEAVAKVLQTSSLVDAHEMGKEGEEGAGWYVRRVKELARPEDTMVRSVYVKGFPHPARAEDGATVEELTGEALQKQKDSELELQKNLEAWVKDMDVGDVKSLRMRREAKPAPPGVKAPALANRGPFKGSIFVEFADKESVPKFLALEPKPTWEGSQLETMSKTEYVEMKRKIYAPDSKPITGTDIPQNPYEKKGKGNQRGPKPFNAWAEHLIGPNGVPSLPKVGGAGRENGDRKRKNEDGDQVEDREVLYDGVKFVSRRTGGAGGSIEVVDEEAVAAKLANGRLLKFTIAKKDGSLDGASESGEQFQFVDLKDKLAPICKPGFVTLHQNRNIAALPVPKMEVDAAASTDAAPAAEDTKPKATAFSTPSLEAAAGPKVEAAEEVKPDSSSQQYPAKGQASFKDAVTDEILAKIQSELGNFKGRAFSWTRASPEEEKTHCLGRARFHAEGAFGAQQRDGGGRGGRGGRGGGRGGRGRGAPRGGSRGGRGAKRPRTD